MYEYNCPVVDGSLSNDHNFDTTLLKSQFPNLKFTALKDGLVQELAYIKGIFE